MILNHIGKKWFRVGHTLQLVAIAAYIGGDTASASYVPDLSNQPVWQSADAEPENGPDSTDYDTDGLPAWYEIWLGTDPISYDTDGDGINDGDEVATTLTNPLSWDTDGNGQTDLADFYAANPPAELPVETSTSTDEATSLDSDSDGLSDNFENSTSLTNPYSTDSDGNGRSDYDDYYYPVSNPDSDSDGVTDTSETEQGTDPYSVDSDGDGLTDGEETNVFYTDPNNAYSRNSQYTDWYMVDLTDSDGGGIPDRIESYLGMNPNDATDDVSGDLDGDGTTNVESYEQGTAPDANVTENYDRDADGMTDVWEVANGLNPDDASDAAGDPDGEGATNSQEYCRSTNPQVSDLSLSVEASLVALDNSSNYQGISDDLTNTSNNVAASSEEGPGFLFWDLDNPYKPGSYEHGMLEKNHKEAIKVVDFCDNLGDHLWLVGDLPGFQVIESAAGYAAGGIELVADVFYVIGWY